MCDVVTFVIDIKCGFHSAEILKTRKARCNDVVIHLVLVSTDVLQQVLHGFCLDRYTETKWFYH